MDWSAIVSICALSVCACILILGGCSQDVYNANWLQFAGIWMLAFWSIGRIYTVVRTGYTETLPMLAHLGLLLYLCGTAYKVITFRPKQGNGHRPPELDARWWPHARGRGKH